jgi:hypothetical protein
MDTHRTVVVQTYADVLKAFCDHPEAKYNDIHGKPCAARTTGALLRRHIQPETVAYIGKEADRIDEVQARLVTDIAKLISEYQVDTCHERVLSAIAHLTAPEVADRILERERSRSRSALIRTVQRYRRGGIPRADVRRAISEVALREAALQQASKVG